MEPSPDRSGDPESGPGARPSSLGRLLSVWVLVGFSLAGLGVELVEAVPVSLPLSAASGGLLLGTVAVCSLWVAGFRPSLAASLAYFVGNLVGQLLLVALVAFAFPGVGLGPWAVVALRCLSIVPLAVLCFTDAGRQVAGAVRRRGRRFLGMPPFDDSGNPRE